VWHKCRKCHRSKEKELSQKPNLCLWGAWKTSLKHLRTEKCPDFLSLYQKICCSFFKGVSIMKVFRLTVHDSTRKTIITRFYLSFRKNIHHFYLISFTGLTLRTETNDDTANLKTTSALTRPLGHLYFYKTSDRMQIQDNVPQTVVPLLFGTRPSCLTSK